jgi:pyridoxamine 5'-phosphate oxidase family protein
VGAFTEAELAYLASQRLGRLATQQPDGTLQASPVGFAVNAERGTIDIAGLNMGASRKYRNVAANGRVAFVVDDLASTDPWTPRCLEIRGWAEAIDTPEEGDGTPRRMSGPVIRIHPTRIVSFGFEGAGGIRSVPAR